MNPSLFTPTGSTGKKKIKRNASRTAFTLIEMLVVIAIIALLASIISPAVTGALRRARSTKCLSNLRQIGVATSQYAGDHKGGLPLAKVSNTLHWFQLLYPYVGREDTNWEDPNDHTSVFWGCPEWLGRDSGWNIPPQGAPAISSPGYGMNVYPVLPNHWIGNTSSGNPEPKFYISQISHPTRRVLVGDSIDWHIAGTGNYGNGTYGFPSWSPGDPRRHGKTANYLFFDIHAASLPYTHAHMHLYNPAEAGAP